MKIPTAHGSDDDPVLHLHESPIPVVEESKFFCIISYRKLSFIPHISHQSIDYIKKSYHILHGVQTKL